MSHSAFVFIAAAPVQSELRIPVRGNVEWGPLSRAESVLHGSKEVTLYEN